MHMFNGELKSFVEFLMTIEMSGRQSRMRSRFVKLVAERLQEIDDVRMELVRKYCNRDENNELCIITQGNSSVYDIPDDKHLLLDAEFNEIQSEEFILDKTEERLDMLQSIRDSILDATGPFSGISAAQYDRWCDIVDTIK